MSWTCDDPASWKHLLLLVGMGLLAGCGPSDAPQGSASFPMDWAVCFLSDLDRSISTSSFENTVRYSRLTHSPKNRSAVSLLLMMRLESLSRPTLSASAIQVILYQLYERRRRIAGK